MKFIYATKLSEAKTAQTYRDLDQVMSEIVQQVLQNAPTGMALNFLNQFFEPYRVCRRLFYLS